MVGVFRIIIGELKMNYVSWIDSDGQAHDISEMPTEYIKNCSYNFFYIHITKIAQINNFSLSWTKFI